MQLVVVGIVDGIGMGGVMGFVVYGVFRVGGGLMGWFWCGLWLILVRQEIGVILCCMMLGWFVGVVDWVDGVGVCYDQRL